ncbi:GAF and ANTAR domain-containing protein [Lentzea flaviverrucosa]|uniref:GAF domain-containing protein n=1 Tax=Lentzea flaviverrucosa TaxID=200379 RepID=A0A1H9XW04_9PSEU|nr:GAF and ANTAR domain-containing protein [Lentzea flaviverrucosa]RDI18421.1 GAF domain-containing protein [Lentzea flaviverrucosa]SES50358.1 GAF domain-containing protein [Lentzea flaviverrucosa]
MSVENMAETFVQLADTLVADFDSAEFMHLLADRCVDTLDVDAAGILLADHHSELYVVGASSERTRLVELFELQHRQGPCMECYLTGAPVTVADFTESPQRWPEFAAVAVEAGFRAVHALPMRLREHTIGALNLFTAAPGALSSSTVRVAQAMADVATIGLLQAKLLNQQELLAEQLQGALQSRVLIEQAKGVLSERLQIGIGPAFETLRRYSRSHNQHLSTVAESVIAGTLDVTALGDPGMRG